MAIENFEDEKKFGTYDLFRIRDALEILRIWDMTDPELLGDVNKEINHRAEKKN